MLPIDPSGRRVFRSRSMCTDARMPATSRTLAELIYDRGMLLTRAAEWSLLSREEQKRRIIEEWDRILEGCPAITRDHRTGSWLEDNLGISGAALRQRVHRRTLKATKLHNRLFYYLPDIARGFPSEYATYISGGRNRAAVPVTPRNGAKVRSVGSSRLLVHAARCARPKPVVVLPPGLPV